MQRQTWRLLALHCLLAFGLATKAESASLFYLGQKKLGIGLTAHPFKVPNCASFGSRLTHIQLWIGGGAIFVERLELVYANRERQNLFVRKRYEAESVSRWLDLGVLGFGDNRCLSTLAVVAQALPPQRNGRPTSYVEVFGKIEQTREINSARKIFFPSGF
ncbi:MAG TPA: hypothetical protein VIH99_05075 [Bdellovibrionota bacterium]|jgi:hypothetical protein